MASHERSRRYPRLDGEAVTIDLRCVRCERAEVDTSLLLKLDGVMIHPGCVSTERLAQLHEAARELVAIADEMERQEFSAMVREIVERELEDDA